MPADKAGPHTPTYPIRTHYQQTACWAGSRYRDTISVLCLTPHKISIFLVSRRTRSRPSICASLIPFLPDDDVIGYTAPRGGIHRHHSLFSRTVLFCRCPWRQSRPLQCQPDLSAHSAGPRGQEFQFHLSLLGMDFSMRAKAIADLA